MTNEISWHIVLAINPGKLENFRLLTKEMVEYTKREPGVLIYERFISDDGKFVYVYERYKDSPSAISHLQAFRKNYEERFVGMVERRQFNFFGTPSDDMKEILDGFNVTYLNPFEGFSLASEGKNIHSDVEDLIMR